MIAMDAVITGRNARFRQRTINNRTSTRSG